MSSPSQVDEATDGSSDSVGCVTQDQMLGSEFEFMETTDDCPHFQHFIQTHMDADPPEVQKENYGSTVIYPLMSSQAIDLSTSNYDCGLMSVEKTTMSPPYSDVPSFGQARARDEEHLNEPPGKILTSHSRAPPRVCLEKRFDSMCSENMPQESHSSVFSNFLTALQHRAENQEAVMHSQTQKWVKNDRVNPCEGTSTYGDNFDQVTSICSQVIAHIVEPNKPQNLVMPKSFSFNFHPENPTAPIVYALRKQSIDDSRREYLKLKRDGGADGRCSGTHTQRRERHNSKERERRKRIRSYCDELNNLVPFCDSGTDKATTLQWTTAYLRYISKIYGDTFKEEFKKVFTCGKGGFLKSTTSPGQLSIGQEMNATLSIPLAAEQ